MATVILVRHGRTTANATGVLAGRLPGVRLDERRREQAAATGERLAAVRLAAAVTSPLERCRRDAPRDHRRSRPTAASPPSAALSRVRLRRVAGPRRSRTSPRRRSGRSFSRSRRPPPSPAGSRCGRCRTARWRPYAATTRAVEAEHGHGAVWLAVSHGDVIKSILADALGTHLDLFQRIQVDPASVSIVRYTEPRPYVLGTNTYARRPVLAEPAGEEGEPAPACARTRRSAEEPGPTRPRQGPRVSDMPRRPRLRPARALRRRHRRRARSRAPSSSRRATGARARQRRAGEAAGPGAGRAHRRAARRGDAGRRRRARSIPAVAPLDLVDNEPLEQPIEEEFRAGTMTLSWDAADERVVIEVFPFTEAAVVSPEQLDEDLEEPEPRRDLPGPAHRRRGARLRGALAHRHRRRASGLPVLRQARSTRTGTSACVPTASGAVTR